MSKMRKIIAILMVSAMLLSVCVMFGSCDDLGMSLDSNQTGNGGNVNIPPNNNTNNNGNTGDNGNTDDNGNTGTDNVVMVGGVVVDQATLDKIAQLNSSREQLHSSQIDAIASYLGGSAGAEALKQIYSLYDTELYFWFANMYDPAVGAFYYSVSARDNIGFLPDLESTRQGLNFVDFSGLSALGNGSWVNMLSADMKTAIGDFVLSLAESDGYYYHPQWGKSISTSRRSRDLTSARYLLSSLGLSASAVDEAVLASNTYASTVVTASVRTGTVSAVASKVVATAASPHLASEAAFRAYMEGLEEGMAKNSYSIGNLISAQAREINDAGFHKILIEYLNKWQKSNGLWEDTVSYQSINGLMKISMVYYTSDLKAGGKAYTSISTVLNFLANELDANGNLTEEALAAVEGITYIYNPWVCMDNLMAALTDAQLANFNNNLKSKAAALIKGTYRKLEIFKKADGGFSYNVKYSAHLSQGASVAVSRTAESDMNATTIAVSMIYNYMLPVFGIDADLIPTVYNKNDSAYLLELLNARTPVEKVVVVGTPEKVTFDDYLSSEGDVEGGVLLYPADSVITSTGDTDMENGEYIWFQSSIVTDPKNAANKVLSAHTFVYDRDGDGTIEDGLTGANKEMAASGKSGGTTFRIVNSGGEGNTYSIEMDLYIDANTEGTIAQLFFINSNNGDASVKFNLNATKLGSTYRLAIAEYSGYYGANNTNDGNVLNSIRTDEWIKIKFELTKVYTGDVLTDMLLTATVTDSAGTRTKTISTGRYTNGAFVDYNIDAFKISYFRTTPSTFYIDNVYATKTTK